MSSMSHSHLFLATLANFGAFGTKTPSDGERFSNSESLPCLFAKIQEANGRCLFAKIQKVNVRYLFAEN